MMLWFLFLEVFFYDLFLFSFYEESGVFAKFISNRNDGEPQCGVGWDILENQDFG